MGKLVEDPQFQNAQSDYEEARLKMNDAAADSWYERGEAALKQRKLAEAEDAFKATVGAQPRHAGAIYRLGEIAQLQGHRPEAAWFYMKTLEIDPNHVSARTQLARLNSEAAPRASSTATGRSDSARRPQTRRPLNNLMVPENDEELDAFRLYSREKASIDWMNQYWYGLPWPLRVLQVIIGLVALGAVTYSFVTYLIITLGSF